MNVVVQPPDLAQQLIDERRAKGLDRPGEVWKGTYVIMPDPNIEHQELVNDLGAVLTVTVKWNGLGLVFPGTNISDQPPESRKQNYRCPDLAVFLITDTKAIDRDSHWFGGPDFAVEIVSPHDRTREKIEFYAKVGTRELLIIDRDPWSLELHRLIDGELRSDRVCYPGDGTALASEVLPLSFELADGDQRPVLLVRHRDSGQEWTVSDRSRSPDSLKFP